MSEKTTHTLLGAFVLGGIVIAVLALMLSAGQSFREGNSQRVVMIFDGSVTGLNVGAPVAIRGAYIGEVVDIRVRFEENETIALLMEVEAVIDNSAVTRKVDVDNRIGPELISAGLRAQLNNLSVVTGLLYVQLDFFPDTQVTLRAGNSDLFEIPTIPSPFEKLVREFDLLNLPVLASDVQAIANATRALTESESFQNLPQAAHQTLTATTELTQQLKAMISRLEPQLEQAMTSTITAAQTAERELPAIANKIQTSLDQLNTTLAAIEQTSQDASALMDPESPMIDNLNQTLNEISRAARSLNLLARTIEEEPQSLLLGRPEENP